MSRRLLTALALALASSLSPPLRAQDAARTLERDADPLLVPGTKLAPLHGFSPARIGCFKADGPALAPIPCQIDERDEDGHYILPLGPEANPEDSDGQLGPRDDLLIMAKDAGPRAASPAWPAGFKRGVELELTDPRDGGRAWVYLAGFDRNAPRSSVDYVTYDPRHERIDGASYQLAFSPAAPIVFDHMLIKKVAGGAGENPIDRMKIRLKAKVWNTIPIYKTESDYTSRMMGYIDGPVRVLRRTRNRLVLFWKIPSPAAIQDNLFYGTSFEFPIVVGLPFDLDTFLSEASLRISVDLKGTPGMRFYNEHNPTPAVLDGVPTADEKQLDARPYRWAVVHGTTHPAGWVNRLAIGKETAIDPALYFRDDAKTPDPPEAIAGQVGDVGYEVANLKGLKKGTHYLTSVMYSFPRYEPGVERKYLAIQDAPLRVTPSRVFP